MLTSTQIPTLFTNPNPTIYVTEADYDALADIVGAANDRIPGAQVLAAELDRARIVTPEDAPARFVQLGSLVAYEDEAGGGIRRVQIVTPRQASIDDGRISVLTPIGAALIGMTGGQTFRWTAPDGRDRAIRVIEVTEA